MFLFMKTAALSWEDLRVLLAVCREKSFLAVERELGLSTSTVAKRVSVLETHLGARVVRREASGATLEPAAMPLGDLAERIEAELAFTARDVKAVPLPTRWRERHFVCLRIYRDSHFFVAITVCIRASKGCSQRAC